MSISIDSVEDGIITLTSLTEILILSDDLDEFTGLSVSLLSDGIVQISSESSGSEITWDDVGSRTFETGLDRGVLYLPDGSAVPWNGLTSVIESFNKEVSPTYYDGQKINDVVALGDFAASMKAVTYPDEFVELEGLGIMTNGVFVGDQMPKTFGLSYRTKIGNDLEENAGYKIHILYNVTAIPHEKTYATISQDPSLTEFEWDITAVPEEVPGFHSSAHFIVDSRKVDPWLLEDIERILYGGDGLAASLVPLSTLVTYLSGWSRLRIIDHGDGTWTAISMRPGFISFVDDEETEFEITADTAEYIDSNTYTISNL